MSPTLRADMHKWNAGYVSPIDLDEAWMGGSAKARQGVNMPRPSEVAPVTNESVPTSTGECPSTLDRKAATAVGTCYMDKFGTSMSSAWQC
jgi:hypothetical protein